MNYLENLKLAKRKWQEVQPRHVTPGLMFWRWETDCGTLACFGGHLATWPEFQAMGVKVSDAGGRPAYDSLTEDLHLEGLDVADHLFGDRELFVAAPTAEQNRAWSALARSALARSTTSSCITKHHLAWKVVGMRLDAAIAGLEAS